MSDQTNGTPEYSEDEEISREEIVEAASQVIQNLSEGLKGSNREVYLEADDLAQNDFFFAGVSDEEGQFAITMWAAEGEEEMLRIDIGTEEDVHALAQLGTNSSQLDAYVDDFIDAMNGELEVEVFEKEVDDEYSEDEDGVTKDRNDPGDVPF